MIVGGDVDLGRDAVELLARLGHLFDDLGRLVLGRDLGLELLNLTRH